MVARNDRQVLDPTLPQASDDFNHLRPDRSLELNRSAQVVVHTHHNHRIPIAVG